MSSVGPIATGPQNRVWVRFGEFEYDAERGELRKHGIRIRVQPQPLAVLLTLLESPEKVVSREELRARLWGADTYVEFEQGLNSAIKRLRDVLCDSADKPRYIETVPGEGYRFVAPLERCGMRTVVRVTEQSVSTIGGKRWLEYRRWLWAALALFAAIAAIATFRVLQRRESSAIIQAEPVSAGAVRIVVLPFVNLTGDPTQEYLCDGLTEEMIEALGGLSPGRLDVIARTSAMHYKNTIETVAQIGRELRVDYLLESSLRASRGGLRITAQLIHTSDASHVWAGEFDVKSDDAVSAPQGVAAAIAESIKTRVAPTDEIPSPFMGSTNAEARRDYLLGRYYWNKRSLQGLQNARTYFERALERDPKYARAYAGLADDYLVLGAGFMTAEEAYAQAKANAQKALELDNHFAEAYASLAYEEFIEEWDWREAEANYRRSLALDPNYATAHEWYAIFLAAMRRNSEAMKEIERALQLDPLSLAVNYNAASIYLQAGRNAEAFELARKALEIDPNSTPAHLTLAAVYERTGQYAEAIAEFEKASRAGGEPRRYTLLAAHCYAVAGNRAKAVAILRTWLPSAERADRAAYGPALVYAALGERDHALYWLRKAVEQRSCTASEINTDWRLDPLRGDAGFTEIRAQFRLPE